MTQHLKAGSVEGLVEKLEAAEVGSRELDREIMALSYRWEQRHIGARCWDEPNDTCCPEAKHLDWVWVDPDSDAWKTTARDGFEFTTSLDAALALAERVLGGHSIDLLIRGSRSLVELNWPSHTVHSAARTAPLALCIAILKARLSLTLEGEG